MMRCYPDGMEKLKEYRTALISAAGTGKIDVREAFSPYTSCRFYQWIQTFAFINKCMHIYPPWHSYNRTAKPKPSSGAIAAYCGPLAP